MGNTYLRFDGLGPNEQSWFYNRLKRQVSVCSGEWAYLELARHPELAGLVEAGVVTVDPCPPPDVEVLDEDTVPNERWTKIQGGLDVRRVSQGSGVPEVLALSRAQIEKSRDLFIRGPVEFPGKIGYADVVEPAVRHRTPRITTLSDLLCPNFVVLYRLAWLMRRILNAEAKNHAAAVESKRKKWIGEYHEEWGTARPDLRRSAERLIPLTTPTIPSVGTLLFNWGAMRKKAPPSPSTLYRYWQSLGLTRRDVDHLILRSLLEDQPILVIGRIGQGFVQFRVGPYMPGGQASRLTADTQYDGAIAYFVFLGAEGEAALRFVLPR